MKAPAVPFVVLAAIAALQGLALLGYAAFDVVEAVRVGITGPAEVSNPMALLLLIAITLAFGAGLLVVAWGWWHAHRWARAPFILAQLIIGLIGYELTQSAGPVEKAVGFACLVVAVGGLVLAFLPVVRRVIDVED